MAISGWFKADEIATDDLGWTANLAIFRVIFLAAAVLPFAYDVLRWTELVMPSLPPEVWAPTSFYRHIPYYVLANAKLAHAMALADVLLIALALVGFFTRTTLTLATVMSLYLFGLPENLGKVHHFQHIEWFMALLAAGPSGEMLSVDAVIAAIRRADRGEVGLEVSRRAALSTLRYAWIMIGLLYLGSGLAKLHSAWLYHWVSNDNLRHIMWRMWFERRMYSPGFTLPIRVDKLPGLVLELAGAGVITLETGFLALVLFRWSRRFLILAGLAFHAGNGLVLGIWFSSLMVGYACLVDWTSIGRRLTKWVTGQREPLLVVYDGTCEMCRRTIAILKTLDICGALDPVSGFSDDPRRLAHPEIMDEMVLHDLYVVGNEYIAGGYDAYRKMATSMIVLWPLALIMWCPPVAAVGRRIYRRVADARHCAIEQTSSTWASAAGSKNNSSKNNSRLALHVVGILLVLGELTFSSLAFATQELRIAEMPMGIRPSAQVASRITARVHGRALFWPWPFDLYPTFTGPGPSEDVYRRWEVKLVAADGSEISVAPEVFARAIGDWSASAAIMADAIRNASAKRRASVSRMLWSRLPESARLGTVTIRRYDSVYSTNPDDVRVVQRILIDNFPVRLLTLNVNTLESSRRDQNLGPTIAVRP
jgi:predicted DCC family thiol-disulfide oxidoreductase YuxK